MVSFDGGVYGGDVRGGVVNQKSDCNAKGGNATADASVTIPVVIPALMLQNLAASTPAPMNRPTVTYSKPHEQANPDMYWMHSEGDTGFFLLM